ncbi:MAG TPA: polyprenyl diphosphate synthase [Candidatus Bathyarchaeia archaeon]|nr:polyprenyl diphosphate synthase [Candidatus Bathyarchaeia archaeon]
MGIKDKALEVGGFYTLYSKKLEKDIRSGEIPKHIAIILDGNRRWAKRNLVLKLDGHFQGADAVEKLLDWCEELNIKIITLYVLSAENLTRDDDELHYLYGLINARLEKLYNDPRIHRNQMRIKAIGRVELLPDFLRAVLNKLETVSKDYDNHYLNIAIAYGGQHELVDAVRKIATKIKDGSLEVNDIDKDVIESCLYTSHLPQSSPDMILRTSGEKRLSGFLMWQSAYSELVFMDVYWPEFRKIDLMRAIRTYQKRARRLGK